MSAYHGVACTHKNLGTQLREKAASKNIATFTKNQTQNSLEVLDVVFLGHLLVVDDEPVGDGQRVGGVALVDRLDDLARIHAEFLEQKKEFDSRA